MPLTSSKEVGSKQRAGASTLQGSEVDGGRDDCRWQLFLSLSLSKVTSNRVSFISDHPLICLSYQWRAHLIGIRWIFKVADNFFAHHILSLGVKLWSLKYIFFIDFNTHNMILCILMTLLADIIGWNLDWFNIGATEAVIIFTLNMNAITVHKHSISIVTVILNPSSIRWVLKTEETNHTWLETLKGA